ncbi:MAG TPA: tRNA (adenosine(37)-N6)-threonylcarbamoyltransferase complex dimerization subunit type 1 TsaB [Quisquiliibacterium sp.]|nr:tRNA (adenosine(37)-N6)-threonylcarbamoyltransferase complex dimerization subunit type 1 TsaB [Quisquiliibacterium sp.]
MTAAEPDPQPRAAPEAAPAGASSQDGAASPAGASSAPCTVLALATSTEWCSVALLLRTGASVRVEQLDERAGNEHSRRVLPMARALLSAEGLDLEVLDAIGFDAGPGSFTGIRIGCGVAQGLGFGLARPVAPIPSLEAIAWQAHRPCVVVAMDARMGEVYLGAYGCSPCGAHDRAVRPRLLAPIAVLPAAQAAERLEQWRQQGVLARDAIVVGDGATRYAAFGLRLAELGLHAVDDTHARAGSVARLAEARLAAGDRLDAALAAPLYVRDKVALDVEEQRRLRAGRA